MKVSCPFCGSENTTTKDVTEHYPIPFCADAEITHELHLCPECEEDGDFDGTLDDYVNKALQKANEASASSLMNDLVAAGVTMTYFEKALRIPFKTTARWKRGEISQAALALLRIIRFEPHLLQVADENFSEQAQVMYQLSRPCHFFWNQFDNPTGTMHDDGEKLTISYSGWYGAQRIETGAQPKIVAMGY